MREVLASGAAAAQVSSHDCVHRGVGAFGLRGQGFACMHAGGGRRAAQVSSRDHTHIHAYMCV
eukprot:325521-Chlamydomonas_euryale.AAC.1